MKRTLATQRYRQHGGALMLTMIMSGIALAVLAGAMKWSAHSNRLTHRSVQHTRSVAAAEASTEKVFTQMTRDYLGGGEALVGVNLANYRALVPKPADSPFWNQWEFNDAEGNVGQTFVKKKNSNLYIVLNSSYAGLRGFVSTYSIASHARDTASPQDVIGGVLQEVQLARIPIFQFAMYSSGDMEISCGQLFTVTGRVHSNRQLYIEPDSALTFQSDVTAVGNISFARHPLDTREAPVGTVVYEARKDPRVAALTLPIGTTNSPEAIREIIQPPPAGEDPTSAIGRLRYHNQSDLVLVVSDSGISATSQKYNSLATIPIPTNQLAKWVTTTNSFRDAREGKTVKPIDINVGALTAWSKTNGNLNAALGGLDRLSSIYVVDKRTLAGTALGAVRVVNGRTLPTSGLTVSTARPLYVLGDYNQMDSANLGTANTTTTKPASLVGDSVTILSTRWEDSKSTLSLSSRAAGPTTVNAAIMAGVVETTAGKYSGGMENFPRYLEAWGSANLITYNGSMVKMFPSLYATNYWNNNSDIYNPPKRNWAYDLNFDDGTKLPPLTPGLQKVFRSYWVTVAPGSNVAAVTP